MIQQPQVVLTPAKVYYAALHTQLGTSLLQKLADNGQLATQYVDMDGAPSMDVESNPNGRCPASIRPDPGAGASPLRSRLRCGKRR